MGHISLLYNCFHVRIHVLAEAVRALHRTVSLSAGMHSAVRVVSNTSGAVRCGVMGLDGMWCGVV